MSININDTDEAKRARLSKIANFLGKIGQVGKNLLGAKSAVAASAPTPTPTAVPTPSPNLDAVDPNQLAKLYQQGQITAQQANEILQKRAIVSSGGNYSPESVQMANDMINFKSAAGNTYQIPNNEQYNKTDVKALVEKYFPKDQVDNAMKVIQGESGGNWYKIGDDYPIQGQTIPSYGLFQIRGFEGRPNKETLMNPEENVKYAANLYNRSGNSWSPWTVGQELGLK